MWWYWYGIGLRLVWWFGYRIGFKKWCGVSLRKWGRIGLGQWRGVSLRKWGRIGLGKWRGVSLGKRRRIRRSGGSRLKKTLKKGYLEYQYSCLTLSKIGFSILKSVKCPSN